MKTLTSKMAIKSDLDNIKGAMLWLKSNLRANFEQEETYKHFRLCVQEAITNSIIHGNKSNKNKNVTLSYALNEKIEIKIQDEGPGILLHNQNSDSQEITKDDLLKESGRGIMLMKHFCDEVIFNKNSVTLIMQYK